MKYCKNCNIFYQVPLKSCIFCQNKTEDREPKVINGIDIVNEAALPRYRPITRQQVVARKLLKLLVFAIIVAAGFCLYFDITETTDNRVSWSIIMICSGAYVLLMIGTAASSALWVKKVLHFALLTILELTAIDLLVWEYHWAVAVVVPFGIIAMDMFASIILIFKGKLHDYLIYVVNVSLLGIIPLLSYLLGWVELGWPSLACALYCLITMLGLIIFCGREFFGELARRLHV